MPDCSAVNLGASVFEPAVHYLVRGRYLRGDECGTTCAPVQLCTAIQDMVGAVSGKVENSVYEEYLMNLRRCVVREEPFHRWKPECSTIFPL